MGKEDIGRCSRVPYIIIAVFIIGTVCLRRKSHESIIDDEVRDRGGIVISVEARSFLTGYGPFVGAFANEMIYKINYEQDGHRKIGWVKMRRLGMHEWIF